jgi:hypothetical protein
MLEKNCSIYRNAVDVNKHDETGWVCYPVGSTGSEGYRDLLCTPKIFPETEEHPRRYRPMAWLRPRLKTIDMAGLGFTSRNHHSEIYQPPDAIYN